VFRADKDTSNCENPDLPLDISLIDLLGSVYLGFFYTYSNKLRVNETRYQPVTGLANNSKDKTKK